MSDLKKTPLNQAHRDAGAKMVDFGGWDMPVQYSGIVDEHTTVRTQVGLFDVSHMGEVDVTGPNALAAVNRIITNDLDKIVDGQALYTAMCNDEGGIVDDLVVYRMSPEHIFICVNAANREKDFRWIEKKVGGDAKVVDKSDDYAQIAVQGPKAEALLARLTDVDLAAIGFYHFDRGQVLGHDAIVSRTGYTGEDGFEIYTAPEHATQIWNALLEKGTDLGVKPAGLGARDSLRLEAKMCLYGNDIDDTTNPLEASLGWVVKLDKSDFVAKSILEQVKADGPKKKLVGFEMTAPGIARHDYAIYVGGEKVGRVTSGTKGPTVNKAIGMGYVSAAHAKSGTEIEIEIRNKRVPAVIVKGAFYKRPK